MVKLWCPDCCGEDFQGCFEGGTEILSDRDGEPNIFATRETAEEIGELEVYDTIWKFEVVPA
jgi:hypothetical protein